MVGPDASSGGDADRIIDDLVGDLKPVRRIPRLRIVFAAIALAWGAGALVKWMGGARMRPDLWTLLSSDVGFAAIFAGLLALGAGGLVLAVAAGVPGRESAARAGRGLAWAGGLIGCVVAPALVLAQAAGVSMWPKAEDYYCVRGALRVRAGLDV